MRKPTKAMNKAWSKAAERYVKKHGEPTLGMLAGGCPNCGHMCDFNDKTFSCIKCGWNWKKEVN